MLGQVPLAVAVSDQPKVLPVVRSKSRSDPDREIAATPYKSHSQITYGNSDISRIEAGRERSPLVWNDFRPPLHKEKGEISADILRKTSLIFSRRTLVEPKQTL